MAQKQIRDALSRLVLHSGEGEFVIFEDRATGKFVQFASDNDGGLIFDLPAQSLTPKELSKAVAALERFEISLEEWEVQDKPGGRIVGKHKGFTKNMGNDSQAAADVAWVVFLDVFGLNPSFDLQIEES